MVICQTLWVNKNNLLKDSFGWLSPEHHLMGWALSSLKLKKIYPTVNLHTDDAGIALLKNEIGLPYTNFFNDYSNIKCQPGLWALPKLLTYAKQDKPFLHVDGDVFVWRPFEKELLSSGLIAQNIERGTAYYKSTLTPIAEQLKYIPGFLKRNLLSLNMRSYNAGILGGHDIDFFKRYVAAATHLVKKNNVPDLHGNFNIIFEQLLFFSCVLQEKKNVACLFPKMFNDIGYNKTEMASFTRVDQLGYLHLIGTFKRDKEVCDWVARQLYQENEEIYLRIISLFKKRHYYFNTKIKDNHPSILTGSKSHFTFSKTEKFIKQLSPDFIVKSNAQIKSYVENSENLFLKELYKYEQKLNRISSQFNKIDSGDLKQLEIDSINSVKFLSENRNDQLKTVFKRNPHFEIIHSIFDWTTMQIMKEGYLNLRSSKMKDIIIGIVPELFFSGYREVVLDQICVNLIVLCEQEITWQQLYTKLHDCFPHTDEKDDNNSFDELILLKMEYLIANKILFVS